MTADNRDLDGPEYDYFDAMDDEDEQGSRGPIFVVVGIIVLAAFMGVVWVAYHQGVREGRRQPPLLVADAGPIKEVPADSGAEAPKASPALEALGGDPPQAPEVLMPPPEAPIAPPPAPEAGGTPPAGAMAPPPGDASPGSAEADEPVPAAPAPKPEPVAAAPEAAPAEAPPAPVAAGSYLVQVGSFRSSEEAMQSWTKLKGKNGDLLGDALPNVAKADLGEKGVYYRLRFGPFADKSAAVSACESLKARKQNCLIVKS